MTVSTSAAQSIFLGDGSNVSFSFDFVGVAAADISVQYNNGTSTVTLDPSQYVLYLNPPDPGELWGVGGTCTYPTSGSPIASGTSLTIIRTLPYTQVEEVADQGNFYPTVIERGLDKLEMQIQQLASRTLRWRGTWTTATDYNAGDLVIDGANGLNSGSLYLCINNNTSGVWATDLTAGDWILVIQANIGTIPLPLSISNGGTGATDVAGILAALGIGTAALENIGLVIVDDGSGNLTIGTNQVTNAMLAQAPAYTVKGNPANTTANEQDIALSANSLFGLNDTMGPITLGTGLSMSGNVLSATGGGGGGGATPQGVLNCSYAVTDTTGLITPTYAAWSTAPLNTTVENSITGASRSGSVITLPVGKYVFSTDFFYTNTTGGGGSAFAAEVRLRDVTNNVTITGSTRRNVWATGNDQPASFNTSGFGYIEVTGSPITVELQYYFTHATQLLKIGTYSGTLSAGNGETVNWATVQFVTTDSANNIFIESDTSGVSGSNQVVNIISLTQAEYDGIGSPDANTLYIIDG